MEQTTKMSRYSIIADKNPREIVLLRGTGCRWRCCTFCDYHLDSSDDTAANYRLNREALSQVTGKYQVLEVINSGSFPELDEKTMKEIETVCRQHDITQLHFECHWMYRKKIPELRKRFAVLGIQVKIKIGVETFDADYREWFLKKGIFERNPKKIAEDFNECCLLFGLSGQSAASMKQDIETGLSLFERVCINIMEENTTSVKPDPSVIHSFLQDVFPNYINNSRVDILLHNTDFGVGGI